MSLPAQHGPQERAESQDLLKGPQGHLAPGPLPSPLSWAPRSGLHRGTARHRHAQAGFWSLAMPQRSPCSWLPRFTCLGRGLPFKGTHQSLIPIPRIQASSKASAPDPSLRVRKPPGPGLELLPSGLRGPRFFSFQPGLSVG